MCSEVQQGGTHARAGGAHLRGRPRARGPARPRGSPRRRQREWRSSTGPAQAQSTPCAACAPGRPTPCLRPPKARAAAAGQGTQRRPVPAPSERRGRAAPQPPQVPLRMWHPRPAAPRALAGTARPSAAWARPPSRSRAPRQRLGDARRVSNVCLRGATPAAMRAAASARPARSVACACAAPRADHGAQRQQRAPGPRAAPRARAHAVRLARVSTTALTTHPWPQMLHRRAQHAACSRIRRRAWSAERRAACAAVPLRARR